MSSSSVFQEIFSQSALKLALSRTRNYRDAFHPDPRPLKLTPSVALVSRLPLAELGVAHALFPAGIAMPAAAARTPTASPARWCMRR